MEWFASAMVVPMKLLSSREGDGCRLANISAGTKYTMGELRVELCQDFTHTFWLSDRYLQQWHTAGAMQLSILADTSRDVGADYFKHVPGVYLGGMNEFLSTLTTCAWLSEGVHGQSHDESWAQIPTGGRRAMRCS